MFDVQLFAQTVLCFASCFAGAVTCITLSLAMKDFENNCILYGSFIKFKTTTIKINSYGSRSTCSFIFTIHSVLSIVIPFGIGCYFAYAVFQSFRIKDFAYKMWVMPFCCFAGVVTFFVLIVSGIISAGFASFCHSFVSTGVHLIARCAQMDSLNWTGTKTHKSPHHQLQISQVASWVCFLLWLVQFGLCVLRFFRNRRRHLSESTNPTSDQANFGRVNPSA